MSKPKKTVTPTKIHIDKDAFLDKAVNLTEVRELNEKLENQEIVAAATDELDELVAKAIRPAQMRAAVAEHVTTTKIMIPTRPPSSPEDYGKTFSKDFLNAQMLTCGRIVTEINNWFWSRETDHINTPKMTSEEFFNIAQKLHLSFMEVTYHPNPPAMVEASQEKQQESNGNQLPVPTTTAGGIQGDPLPQDTGQPGGGDRPTPRRKGTGHTRKATKKQEGTKNS